jgi:membrane protein
MFNKYVVNSIYFLRTLAGQFIANGGIVNASALTYTTLFAVVPLMTVTYSVLALVPSFQEVGTSVQDWVFSNFVPATGEVVQKNLQDFTAKARKLTAVGAIFLFVTSVMMMKNIEAAFNRIWRVKQSRKGISSFLLYWAILSLGPILIGVGLLVSSYIASLSFVSSATQMVGRSNLLQLLPMLLSIAAFTLLYCAVPNCRVPFKNALIGAVVVALLFEFAKRAFALLAVQFPSYELIYGAFAAVPLFLAWIFITWMIILLGAELTRLLTVFNTSTAGGFQSNLHTIIGVLRKLWIAQRQGVTLTDEILLAQVAGLNQQRWDEYQQLLLDAQIICRSEQGEYLLARDLNDMSLDQLRHYFPWPVPKPVLEENSTHTDMEPWVIVFDEKLVALQNRQEEILNAKVQSLFVAEKVT